jgi:hypothetical protein
MKEIYVELEIKVKTHISLQIHIFFDYTDRKLA